MNPTLHIVDAFTSKAFAGNPAAVCLLQQEADATWMQAVAAEMNLSETAFLVPNQDGFGLRWFTPAFEVDLCGHATLASAHTLWQIGKLDAETPARFHTRSGLLTATRTSAGIVMDFPAEPASETEAPAGLASALGARPAFVGRNRMDYLVELGDASAVKSLEPDMTALAEIETRGIMVTARADDPDLDFVSRFFGPRAGILEDPVTGSAHCCLGPYWADKLNKTVLEAAQVSARGGRLTVTISGDRVQLAGHAVTVLEGQLASAPPAP